MTGRIYHTSLHAEMNALFQCIKSQRKNRLRKNKVQHSTDKTVYVVRLLGNNSVYKFGCSKPCVNCQYYLALHNVTKIKYTDIVDGIVVLCEMRLIK